MSTKKKKEPVIPKPLIKGHTMPIDPALFNPSTSYRYRSDLDKELAEDERMEARDLRALRVREMKAKREARIRTFESQSGGGTRGSGASREREEFLRALRTDPKVRDEWYATDAASRAVLMTTFNTLAQQGQSTSALATYLPYFMTQQRQNPQTTPKDLIEMYKAFTGDKGRGDEGKNIVEAIKLGVQLTRQNQPKGTNESVFKETMEFLKPLYDTLNSKDKELYNQQFSWLQSQIQPLSQQIEDATKTATAMGFTKGGSTMEIEKMKIDHERWKTEQDWKREEWRDEMKLKKETEKSRWNAITEIGTKWMDKVAPIIDAGIGAAQQRITGTNPPTQTTTVVQQTGNAVPCTDCGTLIPVKGTPDSVTCPNPECKAVMTRQPMK